MPKLKLTSADLRKVKDQPSLFALLRRLGWPLINDDESLTYTIAEVGTVCVNQLLPFANDDPWLILLVEYQGPFRRDDVRKTLKEIRRQQRQQGRYEGKGVSDILFICAARDYTEVEFVRFIERGSRQPKLKIFGWRPETSNQNRTVCEVCLPALALEVTREGHPDWATARWSQAWDVERVTKEFFNGFDKRRKDTFALLRPKFGPPTPPNVKDDPRDSEANWATSVQLNRLLFVYFLADQGFLQGGVERLQRAVAQGNFHKWFATLALDALGIPGARPQGFEDVAYLNGGLFVLHETEQGRDLHLPDHHYRDWLDFLGQFRWTLSESEGVNTISPHILGYLFERYINQKQMGAYYTKEDVTGYICRSTIIPRFFDKIAEALGRDAVILDIGAMSEQGNRRYIFPSVKQKTYLPTETNYEYDRRMERLERLEQLELREADDFITNNLDLELLAEDWIATRKDPRELLAAYDALQSITILDPTVGSGAFLLAALEILAPLYDVALRRMEGMVEHAGHNAPEVNWAGELNLEEAFDQKVLADPDESKTIGCIRKRLDEVSKHGSNSAYFIRKRILLNNLFGVDIMPEAVEICKLRLYLALVSAAAPGSRLEPLPDVDLNYRAGNALVGFVTREDVRTGLNPIGSLNLGWAEEAILERSIAKIEEINQRQESGLDIANLKGELLIERAAAVEALNRRQAEMRGLQLNDSFIRSHHPFNWLAEFPTVMLNEGGFDALVGNPPWIEMEKVKDYKVLLPSAQCGNLYAPCLERALSLTNSSGRLGMIVPVSAASTESYKSLRAALGKGAGIFTSSFNDRPSRLFEGSDLEHCRCCIILRSPAQKGLRTTGYLKWSAAERDHLMTSFLLMDSTGADYLSAWPKFSTPLEYSIWKKLKNMPALGSLTADNAHPVFYTRKLSYFVQVLRRPPKMFDSRGEPRLPSELKRLDFSNEVLADCVFAALNSSIFYWFLTLFSDCRNLNKREIMAFPLGRISPEGFAALSVLANDLDHDLSKNAKLQTMRYKEFGEMKVECFFPRHSKDILDEIDRVLARHYGLNDEELEFIISYDIKYRLGRDPSESEKV